MGGCIFEVLFDISRKQSGIGERAYPNMDNRPGPGQKSDLALTFLRLHAFYGADHVYIQYNGVPTCSVYT